MKRSKENPTQLINCMKHITFIKIDCMAVFYLVAGLSALWVAWLPGCLANCPGGWLARWNFIGRPWRAPCVNWGAVLVRLSSGAPLTCPRRPARCLSCHWLEA